MWKKCRKFSSPSFLKVKSRVKIKKNGHFSLQREEKQFKISLSRREKKEDKEEEEKEGKEAKRRGGEVNLKKKMMMRWSRREKILPRCCGVWSWIITTIFVSHIFYRGWMERISNSCTRWIVRRERWWRDHLALVIWRRSLILMRCRRYRLWKLRGRINRRGRVTGGKHGSALELL